jgi:hypothetical protein
MLIVALSGCASSLQTYSSPEHQTFDLDRQMLIEGGIAFLTPSTITGHEEDKQALAHVFAQTVRIDRPDVRVVPLPATISAVNRAGLAVAYRAMYHDQRETGVFDAAAMRQIAKATGVRYLAQLKLAGLTQGARGRLSLLGLSLLQTHYANLRVFLQVWDSHDGSIAWEGTDEVTFAIDTQRERPFTVRAVAARAAQNLVGRLP